MRWGLEDFYHSRGLFESEPFLPTLAEDYT